LERPDELRSFARKCRELAAAMTDDETRKSLELLARDYEEPAGSTERQDPPNMPEQE
jgi:hypothetical protein